MADFFVCLFVYGTGANPDCQHSRAPGTPRTVGQSIAGPHIETKNLHAHEGVFGLLEEASGGNKWRKPVDHLCSTCSKRLKVWLLSSVVPACLCLPVGCHSSSSWAEAVSQDLLYERCSV